MTSLFQGILYGKVMKKGIILSVLVFFLGAGLFAQSAEYSAHLAEGKLENLNELYPFIKVPGKDYCIGKTEVTQELYEKVMGENPSYYKGDTLPVEKVSWYDAIYFCNKLSLLTGRRPIYSVNGETDINKWNYIPHKGKSINGSIHFNTNANGFRLPTNEEWEYAAKGGESYKYSGSDNIDDVAWSAHFSSGFGTHPVAEKTGNAYGLYDMSGNVWEWVWDSSSSNCHYLRGGSCYSFNDNKCEVSDLDYYNACEQYRDLGFRLLIISD